MFTVHLEQNNFCDGTFIFKHILILYRRDIVSAGSPGITVTSTSASTSARTPARTSTPTVDLQNAMDFESKNRLLELLLPILTS